MKQIVLRAKKSTVPYATYRNHAGGQILDQTKQTPQIALISYHR